MYSRTANFRSLFIKIIAVIGAAVALPTASMAATVDAKPTIVLVHGAMADSSSWSGVIPRLQADGYRVVSAANPLRGLSSDATYVSTVVKAVRGPVVLVGHSYGGTVISNTHENNVQALVYVAALAPEAGESTLDLVGKFPGSVLGPALAAPVDLPDGAHDLYVDQARFREPFAADLPEAQTRILAATLRPVEDAALKEASGTPAWKTIPSWFVYGTADKSIPAAAHAFMAERAKAKDVVAVPGASHLVMLSRPEEVARVIEEAAAAK